MLIFGPGSTGSVRPQHSKLHRLAQLRCKVAAVQPARCAFGPAALQLASAVVVTRLRRRKSAALPRAVCTSASSRWPVSA